ncbi:MAG: hypothetical protein V4561_01430 [Bacteroidota bacterium]
MKKEVLMPKGFKEISSVEQTEVNGGGFWAWVAGVLIGTGVVYGERTESMRAADAKIGMPGASHPQP